MYGILAISEDIMENSNEILTEDTETSVQTDVDEQNPEDGALNATGHKKKKKKRRFGKNLLKKMKIKDETGNLRGKYIPEGVEFIPAVTLDNVHITYNTMQAVTIKGSIGRGLMHRTKYEAVKGVSVEVARGQIVGITGTNGAGKSTLLRAIAGIFSPDKGSIDLHGNTVSLLAIGVGFQKELTGRENILLSGLLLGFSKQRIEEKTDEIIEFAGIGDFIDRPVSTYSSGMYSKLAFAVTTTLETDIMLIDEVLAVGDRKFKRKSFRRMKNLISNREHTFFIVSHSEDSLRNLCDTVLWLEEGRVVMYGPANEVLDAYEKNTGDNGSDGTEDGVAAGDDLPDADSSTD